MKKAILATKVGMTQIFNEDGVLTPVDVYKRQPDLSVFTVNAFHDSMIILDKAKSVKGSGG